MRNDLQGKVDAKNKLNEWIKEVVPNMFKLLKDFPHNKITKADGTFTKKFIENFPQSPNTTSKHFYYVETQYSFYVVFRYSHRPSFNEYYDVEDSFYLANFTPTGLSLYTFNPDDFPSNYDAKEIEKIQIECKAAKKVYENLKNKLNYFGEIY